ncbi:ChuX/HutX family heme-like substrate-binding protein [Pseudoduganella namucuonensis]|uniref:Putative hemin transport protein n=1 Tax=Pseudoduganella namucuonensis TaxID=1035707 RepID=A0A1I7ISD5_9BURK|nr:ChuX/HutX family heme-like substrate-binding protein [Pseudoduganella namucuonensis]SFU75859.1 putative hemin transport protein [Pseudoduganella namucuonensis]
MLVREPCALALAGALMLAAPPASALQPSDAEALAGAPGVSATPLNTGGDAARDIMRRALDFGRVTVATVNAAGRLERTGVASRVEQDDGAAPRDERGRDFAGGYVGGDIDLRFNFAAWRQAYAVERPGADGRPTRGLQFFDEAGRAVFQLSLRNEVVVPLFDKLVADFRAAGPSAAQPPRQAASDPAAPEAETARQPEAPARRLAPAAACQLLEEVGRQRIAVVVTLGNGAVEQTYRGAFSSAAACGAQGPDAGVQLKADAIQGGQLLERAGVSTVRFFDRDGDPAITVTAPRARNGAQAPEWTALVRKLPPG